MFAFCVIGYLDILVTFLFIYVQVQYLNTIKQNCFINFANDLLVMQYYRNIVANDNDIKITISTVLLFF